MDKDIPHGAEAPGDDGIEDLLRARALPVSSASLRHVVLAVAEERSTTSVGRTILKRRHRRRVATIPLALAASVLMVLGVRGYFLGQRETPATQVSTPALSNQSAKVDLGPPDLATMTLAEVDSSLGALRQRLDTLTSVEAERRSRTSMRSTHLLERVQTIRKQLEGENG